MIIIQKKKVGYKDFHLDKRLETLPPKTKRKTQKTRDFLF